MSASASSSIVPISSPPVTITLEEHRQLTQSTPDSFASIPVVLRSKTENVSVELDPASEVLTSEEGSKGTLYVTEGELAFISSSSSKGFKVLYPSITIHAVSRSGSKAMIYCQLEETSGGDNAAAGEDELIDVVELKIFPPEESEIDPIFEALSYCAALHPDPNMSYDDDPEDAAFYDGEFQPFNPDDEELSEVGRAALEHLESIIVYPSGVRPPVDIPAPEDTTATTDDSSTQTTMNGKNEP